MMLPICLMPNGETSLFLDEIGSDVLPTRNTTNFSEGKTLFSVGHMPLK